jgi:hypothetical protein
VTEDIPYRARAEDCLQKARDADKGSDKWSWLVMAESFFRLSDFRTYAKHEQGDTEHPVSEYAPKARANGTASSFMNKFRELF